MTYVSANPPGRLAMTAACRSGQHAAPVPQESALGPPGPPWPDPVAALRRHIASWPTSPATPKTAAATLRRVRQLLMQAPGRPGAARTALKLVLTVADQLGLPAPDTATATTDARLAVITVAKAWHLDGVVPGSGSDHGADHPAGPCSRLLITLAVTVASAVHELAADPVRPAGRAAGAGPRQS